ncbi:hypothetical protein LWM68_38050 [Niabella sp. W65]|nr:hypothetical protein [Niabella sp. W65]MCH7368033.1 hypothetical protein [Niabella sp. W65]
MKRIFFVLGIIALFAIGGCLKEDKVEPCVPRTLEQDKPVMTQFAADSAITVTEDPTGLFTRSSILEQALLLRQPVR